MVTIQPGTPITIVGSDTIPHGGVRLCRTLTSSKEIESRLDGVALPILV